MDSGGSAADEAQTKVVKLVTAIPVKMPPEEFYVKMSAQLIHVYFSSVAAGEKVR